MCGFLGQITFENKLIDKSTNVSVVIDQLKYDLIKYNCITYLE